jgi:hypothetical protein
MKIEISIEKDGEEEKKPGMKKPELSDEQKVALGKKLKANGVLTRMERTMLSAYLLEEED